MKNLILTICFWLVFSINFVLGQSYPIQIQALVQHPTPTHLSQLVEQNNQPLLILINTSVKPKSVMLSGVLTSNNGIYAYFDCRKKKPSHPINIPAFGSVTLTGDDLTDIFSNYTILDVNYKGIEPEDLAQNQLFPEGVYTVCVTAFDYNNKNQLSSNPPSGCTEPIVVKTPEPPHITYPLNNMNIDLAYNNFINFNWTPVTSASIFFNYKIRISKVPQGVNPYDAIESTKLLWWEEEGLTASHYLYDSGKPKFDNNTTYAVQITAYDPLGDGFIKNDGKSEIHTFSVSPTPMSPPELLNPNDNSQISLFQKDNLTFNWSMVQDIYGDLNYNISLVKVLKGMSPEFAMKSQNNIISNGENINSKQFVLDLNKHKLERNTTYAWRVQAFDPTGNIQVNNQGYSSIFTFNTVSDPLLPAPIIESPDNDELVYLDNPFSLNIEWSHKISSKIKSPKYTIQIWESKSNTNPQDIVVKQPPYFETQTYNTSYTYTKPELKLGYYYILRVSVTNGINSFENNGISELVVFSTTESSGVAVIPTLGNFDCSTPGCTAELPSSQVSSTTAKSGDILRIGNFLMTLDEVNWNGDKLNGAARIHSTDLIPVYIRVDLNDIRVNSQNEVFEGTVEAATNQDFIQVDWINEDKMFKPDWDGTVEQFLSDLSDFVTNIDEFIDPQVTTGISLPLQLKSNEHSMMITKIEFTPTGATYNLMTYSILSGSVDQDDQLLIFGAENICYSPTMYIASSEQDSKLELLSNEIEFHPSDKYRLKFFGKNNPSATTSSYATFNCDGFNELALDGVFIFDKDLVKPVNEEGEPINTGNNEAAAFFNFVTTDINDFVISINFEQQEESNIAGISASKYLKFSSFPDYTFEIENAILDLSSTKNGLEMQFPEGYPNQGDSWLGIYFENLNIRFPNWISQTTDDNNKTDVGISVNNFIVDKDGLTGKISIGNTLLPFEKGKISEWDYSIENFEVTLFQSDLQSGSMDGQIKIPFFDNAFSYTASINLDPNDNKLLYDFILEIPGDGDDLADIKAWYLGVDLESTSLELNIDGDNAYLTSTFDGDIVFDDKIKDFKNFHLDPIHFEGFEIGYGPNGFDYTLPSVNYQADLGAEIMGFGFNLDGFGLQKESAQIAKINMDINLELGGENQGITVGGLLNVLGKFQGNDFDFHEVELDGLELDASIAGVDMNGGLHTYTNHAVYGDGFAAFIGANISGFASGDFDVRFGKKYSGSSKYSYWSLYGDIGFESTPIPLVEPLVITSFGGGVYYNVNPNDNKPMNDIFALKAGIDMSIRPNAEMFNGQFDLTAVFNTGTTGISLEEIALNGNAQVLNEPGSLSQAPITLSGNITYNHSVPQLSANLNFDLNVPSEMPVLTGNGNFDFLYHPDKWYLHLGTPDNMVGINYKPTLEILGKTISLGNIIINSYFDTGGGNSYHLPDLPALPSQLSQSVRNLVDRPTAQGGAGFVTGFHTGIDFEVSKSVDLWIFEPTVGFELEAGLGGDMALLKTNQSICNGSSNFGIRKWYATGQGYIYLHGNAGALINDEYYGAGVEVDAAATFGLPNPTGFSAAMEIALSLGPIDFDYNTSVVVGEVCNIDPDEIDDAVVRNIKLFKSSSIQNGSVLDKLDWRDIRPNPNIEMTFSNGEQIGEKRYSSLIKEFHVYELLPNNHKSAVQGLRIQYTGHGKYRIKEKNYNTVKLKPDTQYEIRAEVSLIYDHNPYGDEQPPYDFVRIDGHKIEEVISIKFKTKSVSNIIESPTDLYPEYRQRFFHRNDLTTGRIHHNNPYLLNGFDMNTNKVVVRFYPVGYGGYQQSNAIEEQNGFQFYIPELDPSKIYKLGLYLVKKSGSSQILHTFYEYHFKTSNYSTLQEKMEDFSAQITSNDMNYSPYVGFSCESYLIEFTGLEGFDAVEYNALNLQLKVNPGEAQGSAGMWIYGYRNKLVDAYTGEIAVNEFYPEPNTSLILGPLSDTEISQAGYNDNGSSNSANGFDNSYFAADPGDFSFEGDFDVDFGGGGFDTSDNTGSFYNIPAVKLRVRWNENEYVAAIRKDLIPYMNGLPDDIKALLSQPYIPAYNGSYPIKAFNAGIPYVQKTFEVNITD